MLCGGVKERGRMLRGEDDVWVREVGRVEVDPEGADVVEGGVSRRSVRSISNVRLRGVRRGPARAARNCDVRQQKWKWLNVMGDGNG